MQLLLDNGVNSGLPEALRDAITGKHFETARSILTSRPKLLEDKEFFPQILFQSLRSPDPRFALLVVGDRKELNLREDYSDCTPLMVAAAADNLPVLRLLVERGAALDDINVRKTFSDTSDNFSGTALMWAAYSKARSAVQFLLERGADLALRVGEKDVLVVAVETGDAEIVSLLLKAAKAGQRELHLNGALVAAAKHADLALVRVLLSSGAHAGDAKLYGVSALEAAIGERRYGHSAASADIADTISALIQAGAKPNAPTGRYNFVPLALLSQNGLKYADGGTAAARVLIDRGADVNLPSGSNLEMPLHLAASTGNKALLVFLLTQGATIQARDSLGRTALLHGCGSSGDAEAIVNTLLEQGAALEDEDSSGAGALHLAAGSYAEHPRLVRLLLARGLAVDKKTKRGETPLLLAVRGGHGEIVRELLVQGADPDAADVTGTTPRTLSSSAAGGKLRTLFQPGSRR